MCGIIPIWLQESCSLLQCSIHTLNPSFNIKHHSASLSFLQSTHWQHIESVVVRRSAHLQLALYLTLNAKHERVDNIDWMPTSMQINGWKWSDQVNHRCVLTRVCLVNWLVVRVNWTNVNDCNLILSMVLIERSRVNSIRYSRRFACAFNSSLYSIHVDSFTTNIEWF